MKQLPEPENTPVLRTDFSNQSAWENICAEIRKPVGLLRFRANVEFIDDAEFADLNLDQLLERIPHNYNHTFIVVADQITLSHREHALLVIDLFDKPARAFRAVPSAIQSIENNLSIGNMDFEEFVDAVDADGIFRGFYDDGSNPLARLISGR